jgi:hypothetical protein
LYLKLTSLGHDATFVEIAIGVFSFDSFGSRLFLGAAVGVGSPKGAAAGGTDRSCG